MEVDRRRGEPKGQLESASCQRRKKVDASGRVEWIVVGSDGLVRNAKGGAGLLEPIDGA